jgi:DNA-binding MurR/RpiR family transcriptional regulator
MGLFDSILKLPFNIVGSILSATGSIIGISIATVAETLNITESMVMKAKEAGCETYEDIKKFFDLD